MHATSRKISRFQVRTILAFAVAGVSAVASQALGDRVKADNSTDLNLGASWVGNIVPGSGDLAIFDDSPGSLTQSSYSLNLGANQSWLGLKLINFGTTTSITINGANTLTLGSSGIDTSNTGMALRLNNNVLLGTSQTWNLGFSGSITSGGSTNLGGNTLTLSGFSSANFIGPMTNGVLYDNGTNASLSGNDNLTQIIVDGGGSTWLSGTRTVGTVTVANGTLNLASAGALGSGKLLLTGGGFDNVTTAPLTLGAIPITLNGQTNFVGTNSLNMGNGTFNLAGSSTITLGNSLLTISNNIAGNNNNLTIGGGSGTLALSGNNTFGTGTFTLAGGVLNINSATALHDGTFLVTGGTLDNNTGGPQTLNTVPVQIGGTLTFGGSDNLNVASSVTLTGSDGTIAVNAKTLTISGNIGNDGTNRRLNTSGAGLLLLSGSNNLTNGLTVMQGTVSVTGYITTRAAAAAEIFIGNTNGSNAVLSVDGGTVTALDNVTNGAAGGNGGFQIGSATGAVGVLKVNSGVFAQATGGETWVSNVAGAYGAIIVNGGTLSAGFIGLGRAPVGTTGSSIMNVTGGVVNATQIISGSYPNGVTDAATHAVATFSGGTVNTTGANMFAAQQISGMINIMGTALVLAPAMEFANVATTVGEVNLNGGTLSVNGGMVFDSGFPIFNLNGGKLLTRSAIAGLIPTNTRAKVYLWGGGAVIDDGGFADTITQPLIAPFGNGVNTITLSGGPVGGFVAEPMVILTGGGGTGATAIAVLDLNGNVTGFQVTNPGVGYTSAPNVSVTGGGQNFVSGNASIAPNTGGGLTKLGAGSLTLVALNTYAGNTLVGNGTLLLNFNTNATVSADIINPATTLLLNGTAALNGATFAITSSQTANRSQTFANTTVNQGNGPSTINVIYTGTNSATSVTVNLGNLSRSGFAATLNLNNTNTVSVASGFTTINANANFAGGQASILNGWVVYNGSAGLMTWAVSAGNGVTAGAVTPLSTFDSTFAAAKDILVPVGNFTTSASLTINSLRFNNVGAATINAAGGLTIATGGIMVTPTDTTAAHPLAINNGTITSGDGVDLLVWQNNTVNSLTINSAITGNIGVAKIGSGSLILSSAASTYLGKTYVYSGTLAIVADASLGTAPGAPTADALDYLNAGTLQFLGSVNLAATRGVRLNGNLTVDMGTNNTSIGGIISSNAAVGSFGITKIGAGVLTLSNANAYTGATTVRAGSLVLSGAILTDGASFVTISDTANTNAVLLISGGTLSALKTSNPSLRVGTVAGSAGAIRMTSGVITTTNQLQLGQGTGTGAYAALTMTGGTVTSGDWLVVGFNNDRAAFNMGGGSFTVALDRMTVGAGGTGSLAVANLSGGTFTSAGGIFVGEFGTAVVNAMGATVTSGNVGIGQNAGAVGALNLLGGTFNASSVTRGGGTGRVNFNGGTLKATGASGAFLSGLTNAYVYGGNANIDDGGFAIVAGQGLEAPTGQGIGTITMTGGTGFIDTPIVTIVGSGTGAAAIASINYATGALTGITITNPGIGYTGATTVTLSGGGFGSGGAASSSVLYSANVIGGLNKSGLGTLTLSSSNNTFTGPTNINAGTLLVSGTLSGTGAVSLANGSTLRVTGNVAGAVTANSSSSLIMGGGGQISNTVLLGSGSTLSSFGATNTITGLVTGSGNNLITMVDNLGGGVLNLTGGLSIGSNTPFRFDVDGAFNAADKLVVGGGGITGAGAGSLVIFVNNLGGLTPGQTFTLATYTGANPTVTLDSGSTRFGLDTVSLLAAGGSITISVSGASVPSNAYWTGQFGANWTDLSGTNTNFNDTNTANHNSGQVPGANSNVIFDATVLPPITNLNTVLNGNWDIKSLSVNANMTSGVFISSGTSSVNTLILESGGLTNASNAGGLTINSNVMLNQSQTWTNNSGAGLITVNGAISGGTASQLFVTGRIVLAGANTFAGGTTIGNGTVTAGSNGALGSGGLTFAAGLGGRLQVNGNNVTVAGLNGDATAIVENNGTANGTLTVNTTAANAFGGVLQNGGTANTLALLLAGAGTLALSANNTYSGPTTIRGGSLVLSGVITSATTGSVITVGDTANTKAAYIMSGGTLAANNAGAPSIQTGAVANGVGVFVLNSGIVTTASEVWIASGPNATDAAASSYGAMLVNGGTITTGSYLAIARGQAANSAGVGLLQVSAGVVNVNGGNLEVGSFQGQAGLLHGVAVITGGTVGVRNTLMVGQGNSAIVNMLGGVATAGTTTIANTAAQTGILNLDGGTLTTAVTWSAGTGTLNFNGGTLKALPAGSSTLLAAGGAVGSVYVWGNGAILDDNGRAVTVAANLLTPGATQGVTAFAVTNGGSGYIAPPIVQVNSATTGTTGTGATAIAIMNGDSIGTITLTNPGIGYNNGSTSNFPSVTLIGGGGTGALISAGSVSTFTTGGLTKIGTGTVTLSSTANTFTGNTNINAGVLYVTGSLRTSPNINVNGSGGLGGTGTVGGLTATGAVITLAAGSSAATQGAINLQDGLVGTLTLTGSLTATGAAGSTSNLMFDIGGGIGDRLVLGGNPFVTNASNASSATVYLTSLFPEKTGETYTVMTYTNAAPPNVVLNSNFLAFNTVHLVVTNSSVNVFVDTVPAAPLTAYFSANNSTSLWNTVILAGGVPIGNWNTGASNGIPVSQLPGPITDVFLGTTSPNNITTLNSNLGQVFDIKSLTVTSNLVGGATISGSTLTIEAGGISVASGAGGLTINSAVVLNASQTWANNSINAPMTVGGVISNSTTTSFILTKSGIGKLQLNAANTFTGTVTLAGGTVSLGNAAGLGAAANIVNVVPGSNSIVQLLNLSATVGGLSGGDSSTYIENGGSANSTLSVNTISSNTFGGVIRDGFGGGSLGLRITGGGTQVLTNAQSYTNTTLVRNGVLDFAGGSLTAPTLITVGDTAAQVGVLIVDANGFVSANAGTADNTNSLVVGNAAGAQGDIKVTGGTLTTNFRLMLGTGAGGYAGMSVSGGTVTVAQGGLGSGFNPMFNIGSSNGDRAIVNLSGGVILSPRERVTLGTGIGGSNSVGVLNITGGTLDIEGVAFGDSLLVGQDAAGFGSGGILNVSGSGLLMMAGDLDIANDAGSAGIANLNTGGTIIAHSVGARFAGVSTWNFNGGTLKANATAAVPSAGGFLRNISNAYIYSNGATIDDSGQIITVSQILQAPSGNGVTVAGGTFATTSGFIDTPVVIVGGGGGAGATAVANITNGSISSFTITNPGVGYTSNPTITVFGGGGAPVAGALVGTLSLASNIQTGGLTKIGSGTTTLSGVNTFQGGVVVNAGTLLINSNANLGSSVTNTPVNINNGATLGGVSTTTTITHPIVLGGGGGAITAGTASVLTVAGAISGTSLTLASGIINLNGSNTYTGDTTITGGVVRVNGALSGPGTVNVLPIGILPAGKLGGTGSIGGPVVVGEGAELNFLDGASGTLTLNSGLTIGGAFSPSFISFELGSFVSSTSVDALALGSSALSVNAGGASVSLTSFGISAGTYTLAKYGSIGGTGTIALDAGSTQVGASTASLITNGTSLQLIIVGAAIPINAYWTGSLDGNWNTVQSGSLTNFNTTALGALNTFQTPGAITNVFFANVTAGTTFTTLVQDTGINSLTILTATTSPITINGNNTNGTNTLYVGPGGINAQAGSGGLTVNANLGVVASQSWNNDASATMFFGAVSGTGNLTFSGSGGGINVTGPINLTGNLVFSGSGGGASVAGPIVLTGSVLVNGAGSVGLAGINSFGGSLGITGSSTVILSAASSFNGLVMSGTGQLQLNGANTFTGNVALNSGTITLGNGGGLGATTNLVTFASNSNAHLQLNGFSSTVSGLNGDSTATLENMGGAASTLILNSTASNVFGGLLQNGGGGALNIRLQGGGSLTLTNSNNSYTGSTVVRSGRLFLNGGAINAGGATNITVADTNGQTGVLVVNGGTISPGASANPTIQMGVTANANGALILNSGVVSTTAELWVATVNGGYGALIVNGGSLTSGSWLALGRGGGAAVMDVNGGTVAVTGNNLTLSSFGGAGAAGVVRSTATFSGGVINVANNIFVGENNNTGQTANAFTVLTIRNNAVVTVGAAVEIAVVDTGSVSGNTGVLNLNGGTLTTPRIFTGGANANRVSIFNFNGGTLLASAAPANPFLGGLSLATIWSGGAFIDDGAQAVTISQNLLVPTGSGVSSITVTGGSSYIAEPVVAISGGGGTGATAMATVDTNGSLTGIVVTNPGVGYTSTPTVSLVGGGGSGAGTPVAALAANAVTGGLTKLNVGTLILTGANTYAGPTTISAGTLQIGNNGTTGTLGTGAVANAGTLAVNRTDTVTVSNAISGTGSFTQAGTGTTTLSAYSGTGPLNVNSGRLALGGSAQPPTRTNALTIAGTAAAPTAALDIKDGGLIVTYAGSGTTQTSTMYSQILVGKGGLDGSALFTYAGNGITSSTARTNNVTRGLNLFAVGVLNNADLTTFGVNPQYSATRPFMGQTVTPTTVLARYTYAGDINLDGKINIDDYNYIDTAFASPTAYPGGWIAGDFNNDGKINIDDYNVIDTAFAFQGAPLGNGLTALGDTSLVSLAAPSGGSAPVPEPTSLALLALGAVGLLSRRKRRHV